MCSAGVGPRVMVVDDDQGLLDLIAMRLGAAGYDVVCAPSGEVALQQLGQARPRVIISDLRMDGMDGHQLFARLHAEVPTVPVIMLTAHGSIPDAVVAMQRGVFGFLTKPFDSQELLAKVAEAMAVSPAVDTAIGADTAWRRNIVSSSLVMDELLRQARRAAVLDVPVLIAGPRGSGKRLLARAIHAASSRAEGPFIVLDRGELDRADDASTAALDRALASADGGILLIGELEYLTAREQARVLSYARGASLNALVAPRTEFDVRILATAAQPFDAAIRDGHLRADLCYALAQVTLNVPPLEDRRDDISMLVAHFATLTGGAGRSISPEGIAAMQAASWPGSVGQLRSVVEQALASSLTPRVPVSVVQRLLRDKSESETEALNEARRAFEYEYLVNLLETTRGNITHAARIAQRNRTEFYKLLARHDIDPARFK